MSTQKRDLPERSFVFALDTLKLCRRLEKIPGTSRTLANQLFRSATSIGANVEESQAAQSQADFVHKLHLACKEARETHYWLRLLLAAEMESEQKLVELRDEANELVAILTTILKRTKTQVERRGRNS